MLSSLESLSQRKLNCPLSKDLLQGSLYVLIPQAIDEESSMGVTTVYITAMTVSLTVELLAEGHKERPMIIL